MTSSRRARADGRANRERVLAAARDVFRERGSEAEMREVAERAGVGIATLYRGYGNKEGLLLSVCDQAKADFIALLDKAAESDDQVAAMRQFVIEAVAFAVEWGPVFELLASYPAAQSWLWSADLGKPLRRLVEDGMAAGRFSSEANIHAVVHLILGAMISIAHTRDSGSYVTGEALADAVMGLLVPRP
jgi:AcrR family transcriptional regulator